MAQTAADPRGHGAALVSLAGVAKFYGERLIFKGVNLAVEPGRVLLVVGANGAGKSTLLKILAGLTEPTAGERTLHMDKAGLAYLGHHSFVYPRLSARANLRFWARLYGTDAGDERLDALLERVSLLPVAEEPAGTFSRGMTQRLALARVFLTEPQLIFLDEPATGLDGRSAGMLRAEIAQARQRGAALVWVSHNLLADLALADDVVHLERGKAVYCGPANGFTPPEGLC